MDDKDQIIRIHIGHDVQFHTSQPLRSFAKMMNTIGKYLMREEATDVGNDEIRDLATFLNFLLWKSALDESEVTEELERILNLANGDAGNLKGIVTKHPERVRSPNFIMKVKDIGKNLIKISLLLGYEER